MSVLDPELNSEAGSVLTPMVNDFEKNMEMNKERKCKDWCLSYNTHQEMGVYICYNGHMYDNIMTL